MPFNLDGDDESTSSGVNLITDQKMIFTDHEILTKAIEVLTNYVYAKRKKIGVLVPKARFPVVLKIGKNSECLGAPN